MDYLEKLPKLFANGLCIKSSAACEEEGEEGTAKKTLSKIKYVPASEEAKEAFIEAMTKHLKKSLSRCHVECSVNYEYSIGKIRGASLDNKGALAFFMNQNLLDILEELPELAEGEEYVFTTNMIASIKVVGFTQDGIETKLVNCSPWILAAM